VKRPQTWFHARRARGYALILAIGISIASAFSASSIVVGTDPQTWRPTGVDFEAFHAAARIALSGDAKRVYERGPVEAQERAETRIEHDGYYPFIYPPTFLLIILMFGWLPAWLGYLAFLGCETALLTSLLLRVLPGRSTFWRIVSVLAFPAILVNVEAGQNGMLTASAFAAGLVWLDRKPALAGTCLGMLICKPHLAVAVPLILLCGRRWCALAAFIAASASLLAASVLLFGVSTWAAFLHSAPFVIKDFIVSSTVYQSRMASVFGAMRLLGDGLPVSYAVHSATLLTVLAIVAWLRPASGASSVALMAAAGLLLPPYVFDYDLACLAVPLAWLLACGAKQHFLPGERPVMAAAFVLPIMVHPIAAGLGIPIAPLILCALLSIVARRIRLESVAGDLVERFDKVEDAHPRVF
jgi:hypothetical protein